MVVEVAVPNTALVPMVDTADLDKSRHELVDTAKALVVDSPESLVQGEQLVKLIAAAEAYVHKKLDPGCAKANDLHKHLTGQRNEYLVPLKEARIIAVRKTFAHRAIEEAKRRVNEAELRAAAQKEAEEVRLAEAEQLEKQGRTTEAEAVINEPVKPPPVALAPTVPKPELRYRTNWQAVVMNLLLVPREYLQADMTKLNALARAAKTESHIPGVAFESYTSA